MEIPKIIHQIWIQGNELIPDELKKNKSIIKKLHPNWQYILWDEIAILQLLRDTNLEWLSKYYKFDYLHQRVDYAKLIILYLYGGICIDMDAYTKQPLDELFNKYSDYDLIISNLRDIGYIGNFTVCGDLNKCLNNGNFFGKPNSDILQFMIDNVTTKCSSFDYKVKCIRDTTGPPKFNKLIKKYLKMDKQNKSKIFVLDYKYLEPCSFNVCDITDNTYIVHEHAHTWVNNNLKTIEIYYLKYYKKIYFIVFIIILYYLFTRFH